jgi:uncharacterized protein YqjF (DUF2071 family)
MYRRHHGQSGPQYGVSEAVILTNVYIANIHYYSQDEYMTLLPVITADVERRILLNYRADPEVVARLLPAPFTPQTVNGFAVVGICLLRLGHVRPQGLPRRVGLRSENAAHRFAVQWSEHGRQRSGVYIPRRDSASAVNVATGGRFFPGFHERADFTVSESAADLAVAFRSRDGEMAVDVAVSVVDELVPSALFATLADASEFFRAGSVGFSPSRRGFTGMELRTNAWGVEAAAIDHACSSFFGDARAFPSGSIELDSAVVMRNIPIEFHGVPALVAANHPAAA